MAKYLIIRKTILFTLAVYVTATTFASHHNSLVHLQKVESKKLIHVEDRAKAIDINNNLGRGMNMGNTFDATSSAPWDNPTDDGWDNPWKPEYFKMMADLGFTHVRVPIRWEPAGRTMQNAPYTISPVFLERIKTVVDEALENNLYVIINMHHHEQLMENPWGQHDRFLAQWQQIGAYFKDYSDMLLFEILNEPTNQLIPSIWNQFMSEALSIIRETNPDRIVLVGTAQGGVAKALESFVLPDDKNLILTIHYYNPFEFTHQGAGWTGLDMEQHLGTKWYDSQTERNAIRRDFEIVKTFAQSHADIPVHIGEFGVIPNADIDSRVRWTTFCARWFEEQGFSWAFWEFSAGFGIYNPKTETYLQPLVDALLHNPMPEPGIALDQEPGTLIYASDFASNDGWILNKNGGGAAGTLNHLNNTLEVNVANSGNENWHLQLLKTGISLEKDSKYRCTLSISAPQNEYVQFYLDSNNPYDPLFVPKHFSIGGDTEETYYSTFTYTKASDKDTRIVFNLGGLHITQFKLHNFMLEVLDNSTGIPPIAIDSYAIYSCGSNIVVNGAINEPIIVYSIDGRLINKTTGSSVTQIPFNKGLYIVKVGETEAQKIVVR